MIKYIEATNTGTGFITHADTETNGMCICHLGGDMYHVEGLETDINSWKSRVSGVEKTEQEKDDILDALPDSSSVLPHTP